MKDMKNIKVEYGYYDNGNRAWKRVTEPGQEPVVTHYVHDGIHVIAEYDGEGELLKEYVYSDNIDEVLNIKDGSTHSYPIQDGLNSVVKVTDSLGAEVAAYEYEAFGEIKSSAGSLGNLITYTGRWLEPETGDYFYRARYYDSGVGRFLKRDPIGFKSGDWNFYRYVNNGPIINNDPLGLSKGRLVSDYDHLKVQCEPCKINSAGEEQRCKVQIALRAGSEIMSYGATGLGEGIVSGGLGLAAVAFGWNPYGWFAAGGSAAFGIKSLYDFIQIGRIIKSTTAAKSKYCDCDVYKKKQAKK
jgi:RHS repeat-associated protein